MRYNQCTLESGNTLKTVFLEVGKYNIGFFVTLKDDENASRRWRIIEIFDGELDEKDIKDSHDSDKWFKKDWLHKIEHK
jgi:hypothetical protein